MRTSISSMPHSVGVRCTSAPFLVTFLAARSTVNEEVSTTGSIGVRRRGAAPDRGPQPGQELVHAEGLGDVVVGAGVERLDLVRGVGARRQHDDRRGQPAAQARRARRCRTCRAGRGRGRRRRACARRRRAVPAAPVAAVMHLVAAHRQVDAQRPQDLRFVVDHQHPVSWSRSFRLRARRGRPRRSARRRGCRWRRWCRPSPRRNPSRPTGRGRRRWCCRWSPSRWNGANSCSSVPRGDAGALVDDVDQHPVADPARVDPHDALGRVAQRVVDRG